MTGIHPTALIDAHVKIGRNVSIGPFSVIEENVTIHDGCRLGARVVVKSGTTMGEGNEIAEGAIIGGRPQHLRAAEAVGELILGRENIIRENVTIHRGLKPGQATVLGDHNMLMIGAHIAHDCIVGNHVIIANNVLLAGHVLVGDRAYLSGAVGIHQFCRVGTNAMVGGQAHVTRDIPPFITVDGLSSLVVGLNTIGLRRSGHTADDLQQLKSAYRVLYRSGQPWTEVLEVLRQEFTSGPAVEFYRFLKSAQRGIVQERRVPRSATVRMTRHSADPGDPDLRRVG